MQAFPASERLAVYPVVVFFKLLALYPGHRACACLALGSFTFARILGPMSAAAGTVNATEKRVGVPSIVAVANEAVLVPAVLVRPSAGEVVAETREERHRRA